MADKTSGAPFAALLRGVLDKSASIVGKGYLVATTSAAGGAAEAG